MSSFKGARNRTLSRDGYRCRRCFRYRVPLTIHHIKPRREGGTNEAENLITLCCDCHALWHDGEHTTQWESFADFLGAEVHLSPSQSRLLQKCIPLKENQVCVRWPLSLEQLSERMWRWRWIDKPIGLMRKRKYGYVSYHSRFHFIQRAHNQLRQTLQRFGHYWCAYRYRGQPVADRLPSRDSARSAVG